MRRADLRLVQRCRNERRRAGAAQKARRFPPRTFAGAYHLDAAALAAAEVTHVHDTGRGAVIVVFRQRVDGVEVYRDALKVVMGRDLSLAALGGSLSSDAQPSVPSAKQARFVLSPAQTFSASLRDLTDVFVGEAGNAGSRPAAHPAAREGDAYLDLFRVSGLPDWQPARVKRVMFPMPAPRVSGGCVFAEVLQAPAPAGALHVVRHGALRRMVLWRADLAASESFVYRVWADPRPGWSPAGWPQRPRPTRQALPTAAGLRLLRPSSGEGWFNPQGQADPWLPLSSGKRWAAT